MVERAPDPIIWKSNKLPEINTPHQEVYYAPSSDQHPDSIRHSRNGSRSAMSQYPAASTQLVRDPVPLDALLSLINQTNIDRKVVLP